MNQTTKDLLKKINLLIANNDIAEAESLLSEILAKNPDDLHACLLKGSILETKKDISGARDLYLSLSEQFPGNPNLNFKLARLAYVTKEFEAAEQHIIEAETHGFPAAKTAKLRLKIALSKKDYETWRTISKMQNVPPETITPSLLLNFARWAYDKNDMQSAFEFIDQALAIDPRNTAALRLAQLATIDNGEENATEKAHYYQNKIVSLIREELNRQVANPDILKTIEPAKLPNALNKEILLWARSVGAEAPAEKKEIAARLLVINGNAIPPHLSKPTINNKSNKGSKFYDWLDHAPIDSELKRPPLAKYGDSEIIVAGEQATGEIALVFTGLADQAMFPLPIFDRYLAALNLTAIYLRDHSRLLFNNGIASVAPDFAGTVEYLRNLVSRLGARRLITIGASAGGYAAIRYGLALDATCIVGFSAPTNLRADFLADDGRGRAVAKRLQTLPADTLDVLPLILAKERETPIHLVYGEDMREDRRHALYLKDTPGVKLRPLPGVKVHASIEVLAQDKELLPFLSDIVLGSTDARPT